jgi:hypothetical protein
MVRSQIRRRNGQGNGGDTLRSDSGGFRCRAGFESARAYQTLLHERVHALGVVLEIHKSSHGIQLNLKVPQHGKPKKPETSVPVRRLIVERSSVIMSKFDC